MYLYNRGSRLLAFSLGCAYAQDSQGCCVFMGHVLICEQTIASAYAKIKTSHVTWLKVLLSGDCQLRSKFVWRLYDCTVELFYYLKCKYTRALGSKQVRASPRLGDRLDRKATFASVYQTVPPPITTSELYKSHGLSFKHVFPVSQEQTRLSSKNWQILVLSPDGMRQHEPARIRLAM